MNGAVRVAAGTIRSRMSGSVEENTGDLSISFIFFESVFDPGNGTLLDQHTTPTDLVHQYF